MSSPCIFSEEVLLYLAEQVQVCIVSKNPHACILATCSVAVELRELQPSSHTRSLMDMDPPMPDPDVGHISFAAIPRMGPACVSVTSTSERSPRPAPTTTQTAASPATEHASSAGPQLDEQHCAEDSGRAASGREASTSRQAPQRTSGQGKQGKEKIAGPSRDGSKKDLPSLARGNAAGSSASLDSMGEPKKKRGVPDKDGKRCACSTAWTSTTPACVVVSLPHL